MEGPFYTIFFWKWSSRRQAKRSLFLGRWSKTQNGDQIRIYPWPISQTATLFWRVLKILKWYLLQYTRVEPGSNGFNDQRYSKMSPTRMSNAGPKSSQKYNNELPIYIPLVLQQATRPRRPGLTEVCRATTRSRVRQKVGSWAQNSRQL